MGGGRAGVGHVGEPVARQVQFCAGTGLPQFVCVRVLVCVCVCACAVALSRSLSLSLALVGVVVCVFCFGHMHTHKQRPTLSEQNTTISTTFFLVRLVLWNFNRIYSCLTDVFVFYMVLLGLFIIMLILLLKS